MVNKLLNLLFVLLRPAGALYAILMRLRAELYSRNILSRQTVGVPVISVGNVTMGGSGKTPIVIYLAELLKKKGLKPAVVSRGYGGRAKGKINMVSDGATLFMSSEEAGDEPRLIAESVPGTAVLTGRKRAAPCRYAEKQLHCDVIILDDGFQHMHVGRTIDLVLFNGSSLYNNMHVFPGGLLRESLSALGRASCFIITGCKEEDSHGIEKFARYLQKRWEQTPLYLSHFQPRCYIDCTGKTYPLQHITFPVAAFCGIASPLRFRKSLEQLSIDIAFFQGFRDHKKYCKKTMAELERQARMCGAEALLTTEKDLVKLSGLDISLPLYALAMKVDIDPAFDSLIYNSLCRATIK